MGRFVRRYVFIVDIILLFCKVIPLLFLKNLDEETREMIPKQASLGENEIQTPGFFFFTFHFLGPCGSKANIIVSVQRLESGGNHRKLRC